MNPSARTFTLIGLIVFILLMMYQLPTLSVENTELRHVNLLSSILPEKNQKDVDVLPTPARPQITEAKNAKGDTIRFKEKWSKGVEPIVDYANGNDGGMEHFYEQLTQVKTLNRPVRIAYYGDSYIEGDILTSDLRELFQSNYGGNGVGWVDCGSAMLQNRRSIRQRHSGITEYVVVKKPFDKDKQGISERYFTIREGARAHTEGTRYYPHSTKWTVSRLFFYTPSSLTVTTSIGQKKASTQSFHGSPSVQMAEIKDTTNTISHIFSRIGRGTCIYGLALESDNGVILDNFSVRGSPGVTLANMPLQRMQDFNTFRPYDLIVLHFGLNVAVPGNPLSVMRNYTRRMKRVIQNMKTAFPQASIMVMSVPDRDQRATEGFKTMKEVKQLVALQEQLAADTKVCFLNFYQAMGGSESVSKLVERNMANKDYTHLSFKGGQVLAQKIFPSFKEGLQNYQRRKALERQ